MLERLALHRPELRAWAMYDWANSAFMTTILAAVFPIYFHSVAAADLPPHLATARFSGAGALAVAITAVMAPVLGAIADYAAVKKRMLGAFLALGVIATGSMYFIERGDWMLALVLFILGNIGISGSFVFYDSLLPHVARSDELDRVSAAGYALGYVGGGLLLAINLAWIQRPDLFGLPDSELAARLSFASVAAWWLGFSIPLFRRVAEPPRLLESDETAGQNPLRIAFARLRETLGELRRYRQAFVMLVAFLVYNDGVSTIIRLASTYGTEIGIPQGDLITAILLVQFIGIPFAFLFGMLGSWIGAKPAVLLALMVYLVIAVLAYFMTTSTHFYMLAVLVGMVQGGTQALSRSLFASMVPRHKSSEFFGFYGVFDRFGGLGGMTIFTIMVLLTGSSRHAILSVVLFFIVGALLLTLVNVDAGRRTAVDAERSVRRA